MPCRPKSEQVHKLAFIIAIPVAVDETRFGMPSHGYAKAIMLKPRPLGPVHQKIRYLSDLGLGWIIAIKPLRYMKYAKEQQSCIYRR